MKTKTLLRPLLKIVLMLIMLLSWTVIQSDMVYADDETTYTVFLYSGKEGYFGTPDKTMVKFDKIKFGAEFTIDQKNGMVEYTVNYEAEDGTVLHDPETFWGMPGDRPVVSYKRVEGYLPNQYNETRTLTDNAADNVFTFTYREVASGEAAPADEGTDNAGGGGGDGSPGSAPGNSSLYYILGGAIAVAIIAILALLLTRKKKQE